MKKICLVTLSFILISKVFSQNNLIPNPSFDQVITCPTNFTQWNRCLNWNNVNMIPPYTNTCNDVFGTPDFYHSCGSGNANMPNTGYGAIQSNSGPGMIGIVVYNGYYVDYREYISAKLNCSMIPGITYSVSFYCTRSNYTNNVSVKNLGVVLSTTLLSQQCAGLISNQSPQFETNSNNSIATNSWTPLSFTITPTTNLSQITLGNFRNDANSFTTTTNSTVNPQWAKYFIDDVSIIPILNVNTVVSQPNCSTPCGSASIIPTNSSTNYLYHWTPGNYTTSSVACLTPGNYTVNIFLNDSCHSLCKTLKIKINPSPIPTLSIISPATPYCYSDCINLLASGATNYTWLPTNSLGSSAWVCPLNATTYTLIGTNNSNCTSTNTITLNPTPNPSITISSYPNIICNGSNATLTASGASSYTWLPNAVLGNSIGLNNISTTSTYTINGKNSSGCSSTIIYTVTPLPTPTLSVNNAPLLRCSGTPATLTATGANTYVWLPFYSTNSSIIVNPNSSANYTLVGSGVNNCTSSIIYTLNAPIPNPIISVSATPSVFCSGAANTLVATGANSYYWSILNSSSNSVIINPTTTITYYVFGTSTIGCQGFTTVTLNKGDKIQLNPNNYTFCTNASTSIPITVNSNFSIGGVNYYWQPNNISSQIINVSPNTNMVYTVTATSPAGCPNTTTLAVNVTSNCCSHPTISLTNLTSINNSYSNGSYIAANNITLSANSSFQDAEVLMMPNVKITVPAGITLDLDHVHLYACGIKMWQGIEVLDGGQITTSNLQKNSNLIEDAQVGIELDNISSSHATSPIFIDNTIFNKNYIGIKISNASTLTTLPIKISECVFTSRNLSFNSPAPFIGCTACWPHTNINTGGLRTPISPNATLGLNPPYNLQMYPVSSNLKLPYSSTPIGHTGILIQKIGNNAGTAVNAGVDIGNSYSNLNHKYNLFDNLLFGIEIEDASLNTVNNVFQNIHSLSINGSQIGGVAIKHSVSGLMNAQLDLSPTTNTNTDGNKFWNCWYGIEANNVYQLKIDNNLFRSDRNIFSGNNPGLSGINITSNRLAASISYNEFNNIEDCIKIDVNSGMYDMSGTNLFGTYADNLNISQNYFGPQVSSTTPLLPNSEYCNSAITLDASNATNWQYNGSANLLSNKIDRSFRGINVNAFASYSMEIGGNNIRISDDNSFLPNTSQYGIYVKNSSDNLLINQNIITGDGALNPVLWNQKLKCIISENNQSATGGQSPIIKCNQASDSYIGFEFDGSQPNTSWIGNSMFQKMKIGLFLINNGQIGVQGSPSLGCGDIWDDNFNSSPFKWNSTGNFETYVDPLSNAWPGSFLWCGTPGNMPMTNGTSAAGIPFQIGSFGSAFASLDYAKTGYDCTVTPYPIQPSQRSSKQTAIESIKEKAVNIEVFPNPTNGFINIISPIEQENLLIKVIDLTGKTIFSKNITTVNHYFSFNLPSEESLYFLEIQNKNNETTHKKVVVIK